MLLGLLVEGLRGESVPPTAAGLLGCQLVLLRCMIHVASKLWHDSTGRACLRTDEGAEEVVGTGQGLGREGLTQVQRSVLRRLLVLRIPVMGSEVGARAFAQVHQGV